MGLTARVFWADFYSHGFVSLCSNILLGRFAVITTKRASEMPACLSFQIRTLRVTTCAFRVARFCTYRRLYVCQGRTTRHFRYCMSALHTKSTAASTTSSDRVLEAVPTPAPDDLVQYIVLRKDLWNSLNWPLGSIVAQACHASTAALWLSKDDDATFAYCATEKLDHMHKASLTCCTAPHSMLM